jgi:hypothetical protein
MMLDAVDDPVYEVQGPMKSRGPPPRAAPRCPLRD